MADNSEQPFDYVVFLTRVLSEAGGLPPELIVKILYTHGGLSAPGAVAWRSDKNLHIRLELHRDLVAHRAVGASESLCWCADFSISSLLAELHAFGTPHQSALSRTAARHSSPPCPPDNLTQYRRRCAMASLLTRTATADTPGLAGRVPAMEARIGRDASAPFLPVSHRFAVSGILPWFGRAGIPVVVEDPTSVPDLVREYYQS